MYQKLIDQALKEGFEALEIFINKNKGFTINLENNKINNYLENSVTSFVIKGIYQNRMSEIYCENLNLKNFHNILDTLKNNAKIINTKEPAIIFKGSSKYPNIKEKNFNFSEITLEKKIELLKELANLISQNPYFKKNDKIMYREIFHEKKLINSHGLNLKHQNSYAYLYGMTVFEKKGDIQSSDAIQLVKKFEEFNIPKQAKKIVTEGEKKLNGSSLKSNNYSTVFSNEMFALMLENFSNIFNAQHAYRKLTKLSDKEGQKIASPLVNIIDDPLAEFNYFKEKFDDEGVACRTKNIIEKGIFNGFIHNLKTAKIFNQKPTGNGFGGGIEMVGCYLKKGIKTLKEIIAPIENGIYITDLIGLHVGVKTVSGDFSLQASGFKIDKGKITTPIKMIVVSGNFFDILQNIRDIANDFEFQISGFGSASVYVGELMIGGEH